MNKQYIRKCPECGALLPYSSYESWFHATRWNNMCWSCAGKHRNMPTRKNNKAWKGYEEISLTYFNGVKISAERRNIPFNLTIKDLWDLFLKQDRKCALSNLLLDFTYGNKRKYRGNASLDRIDSTKGYIKDNVQWVHKDINFMKQNFEQSYFINMCNGVSKTTTTNYIITPIDIFIKNNKQVSEGVV